MIFYSSKQLASALLLSLGISLATPAKASEYMVIGAEPDPAPQRSLYVIKSGDAWISRRLDHSQAPSASTNALDEIEGNTIHIVTVLKVFENAGGTNFINYDLEFKCRQGLVSIAEATSYDRAGKTETRKSSAWMPVSDNWMGKAEMIACGWKNWKAAQAAWQQRGQPVGKAKKSKKGADSSASFASLGMEYLGDYAAWTEVVDAVWNKHWTDATQPAYYQGTPEELAAIKAKRLAILEQAKTLVAEQEKWTKIAAKLDNKADRMGDDVAKEMSGVGGLTEEQVIARFGIPDGLVETAGTRQLNYYWQGTKSVIENYQVDIIGTQGNGTIAGKIGETTKQRVTSQATQCSRRLMLKEGGALEKAWRVYDFDAGCS